MLKKIAAALAILLVAMGIVAVTAVSASAHHNTISATVTCTGPANQNYLVTWKIENSEKWIETITYSSDPNLAGVAVGDTFGDHEIKYPTEVMTVPTAKTLTLSADWANLDSKSIVKNTNSGSLTLAQFPDCTPAPGTVTLCHSTGSNTWTVATANRDTLITNAHHTTDSADIIPAFTYWAKVSGAWTEVNYPGKNIGAYGTQLLAAGCDPTKIPTAPSFAPAVCTGPGTWGTGSYTIPTQAAVSYTVRLNSTGNFLPVGAGTYQVPVGTFVEIVATGLPAWVSADGTKTWTYTVPSPGDCLVVSTPVAPTVTPITKCETEGSLVMGPTTGVVYVLTGDGKRGAYVVTATPATGYKFVGDQTVIFSDTLGEYTKCATPAPATFDPSQCTGPGTQSGGEYVIPETPGVKYQVKIGSAAYADEVAGKYPVTAYPTTITIQAIALTGYSLKNYTGPWSYTFNSAGDCLTKSDDPVSPTATGITECGKYGSLAIPTTKGVVYALTSGDGLQGAWTVTATPALGYYFAGGVKSIPFSGDLGKFTTCVAPTPADFANSACVLGDIVAGKFSIPFKLGVQYSVSINGDPFVDYELGDYPVKDGDEVEVEATAEPGYTLTGTTSWSHTFATTVRCDLPTEGLAVPSVSFVPITCTAAGSFTVGGVINAEHVVWEVVDGSGAFGASSALALASTPIDFGTYSVTQTGTITLIASSDDPVHFGLADLDSNAWPNPTVISFVKPNAALCTDLPSLALTGSAVSTGAMGLAGGLILLGLGALFIRRRNNSAE